MVMDTSYVTGIVGQRWLSPKTFELRLKRPEGFDFAAGQRLRVTHGTYERDYSIVSAPGDRELRLCIRWVDTGRMSGFLGKCDLPCDIRISGPQGYFTFKPSRRAAIFVATGTGIAPFCAMALADVTGFILFHGVGKRQDLYYREHMAEAAGRYIPCISDETPLPDGYVSGRVTTALDERLRPGVYDFYLCGNQTMIRDVIHLVDRRFPDSRIYTERFY